MIIVSKFKDYYDYVGHQYKDPKIVYNRRDIDSSIRIPVNNFPRGVYLPYSSRYPLNDGKGNKTFFELLVICDFGVLVKTVHHPAKTYPRGKDYCGVPEKEYHYLVDSNDEILAAQRSYEKTQFHNCFEYVKTDIGGYYKTPVINETGIPVFILDGVIYRNSGFYHSNREFTIEERVPVLSEISKFAHAFPAEQLFQLIAAFVGPKEPELVQVADRDRIQQHGFDLKKSFRHRK